MLPGVHSGGLHSRAAGSHEGLRLQGPLLLVSASPAPSTGPESGVSAPLTLGHERWEATSQKGGVGAGR